MTERVTKKAKGQAIFDTELRNRANGSFNIETKPNKAFRAAVLARMVSEIGVSTASASAMFNQGKQLAEAADPTVGLGRDPKTVTVSVKLTPAIVVEALDAAEAEDESNPEMEAEDEATA